MIWICCVIGKPLLCTNAPTTVVKSVFRTDSKVETVGQVSIQWLTGDSSIPLPGSFIPITRVTEFLIATYVTQLKQK